MQVAVAVAVLLLVGSGVSLEDDHGLSLDEHGLGAATMLAEELVLLLAASLPLAFRRAAPMAVLVVVGTVTLLHPILGFRPVPLPLGVLVALYTVALLRRPLVSGAWAAGYVLGLAVGALAGWTSMTDDAFYVELVSVVGTVMLGYGVALQRARASLAERHARELAREQEDRTRSAVAREQARIAREVHDMVAHDISVIVAQAAAARRVFPSRPQSAASALADIEAVGRDALDGLRRLIGLLRTVRDPSTTSPQPSLERLPWLLAQVQRAGLPVDLSIRGRPGPLPATVELNAYRIVQEALTNTLKHAGPARATVTLCYRDGSLEVRVRDSGRGVAGEQGDGYGLIGMQQRVGMLGGDLVAGPVDGHGFAVSARLPVGGSG